MAQVQRHDATQTIGNFTRTPSGGLRIKARFSRTGVQTYRMADGSQRRELRPPEEVFSDAALASIRGAAVTDLHPEAGMVTPETWSVLAKGVAYSAAADPEGRFTAGEVDVNDAALIALVEAKERVEVSLGYLAEYDPTPGVWEGEAYDGIQRKLQINHVALGPEGWGRAGPEVRLRVDCASAIGVQMATTDTSKPAAPASTSQNRDTHRIDGIDFEAGSASHVSAVEKILAERKDLRDTVAKLTAERDEAVKQADANDPKTLADRVSARVDLITTARRTPLGSSYLADKKDQAAASDDSIILAALKALNPAFDPGGLDPQALRGALMFAISQMAPTAPAAGEEPAAMPDAAGAAPGVPPEPEKDPSALDSRDRYRGTIGVPNSGNKPTLDAAEKSASEKSKNRWKQGLQPAK